MKEVSPYDALGVSVDLTGYRSEITARRFNQYQGELREIEEGRTNEYAAAAFGEMTFLSKGNRIEKVTIIYRRLVEPVILCS